ncbi:adhesion G-protein coupled receptor G2 [Seriola lalandi dorsalis]|uniref:adhesion G-protein coupled receptor G2 n=1 Tax=Seriola lalandi dorsalis TaxID=1841481 RepID=UPI000C6F8C10|nr:adhesion G-protein coupled receptor G2 [Seriola lalandi dorsalis]
MVYNKTTIGPITPSTNDTTVYNVTTTGPFTPFSNDTTVYNVITTGPLTPFSNNTTVYNTTTIGPITPSTNDTTVYNVTTTGTLTPSPNDTIVYNETTTRPLTPSPNDTTVYNVTTIEPSTTSPNDTTVYNVTTTGPLTPSPNDTTVYNVTTTEPFTPFLNDTTVHNVTTSGPSTPSPNYTTVHNVTTIGPLTPSPNDTTVYNVTTVASSINHTTVYNVTTAANKNVHNGTTTSNATIITLTPSNYTTTNNVTAVSNNYTTSENVTTTIVSSNNIPTAQQNTTTHYKNTTMSTTASQGNETRNMTSAVDITTKPTAAPMKNHNTTASVTHSITTSIKYNTSTTTPSNSTAPIINHNETTEINFNLSSTASSLTTSFKLTTKELGVNLTTTAANASHEHIATASTTTTTTATTKHDPPPPQINTTTGQVSSVSTTTLQTITLTSATTTTTVPETTQSEEAQEEQVNDLLEQTQNTSQLNSSQVGQMVGQLENLLDGLTVSQAVGQKAVNIISNLMEGDSVALTASANRLIRMVDNLGLKLVVNGDRGILSSNSLVLAVRTVDGTNFPATSVNIFNTDNVQLRALSRSRSKRSGSVLGSVFLPSNLTAGLSPEQQQQASRVQFTFYTKSSFFQDAALDNNTLVSPVLGSSVANLSVSNLTEDIQFTIRNINPIHGNFVASCAFWDFTLNGDRGGWSSAGCFVVNSTPEETTCSCNHLTSFAILLDLSRGGITDHQQAQVLTFITYIGCGISAIFLAVTLLTYLSFEKLLRDIPAKILVQLCCSLLLLNLVFLLDGWLVLYPAVGLCTSTAFFLHYFLLTSFTWAGLEALHMYLSIVQVFTPYLSRYMLKFTLMGWGIPLLVVIITLSVDKDNYGLVTYGKYTNGTSDDFCWLRNNVAFYVGVVAYFLLILVLCLLVFIVVMVQLARIKRQNPQNQSPNRGLMTDLRSIAGLSILLGLTWGFALFAWGPLYLPFVYLFSIFNSLQGFLVFVFHCAVKENVRRQWRTYLCCGRLRLPENSDWSRTATQNNRNLSVTAPIVPRPLTSRRSSVISDGTNSSASVFADSGISEGYNSDVVLNELHRRTLSPQGEA